MKGESPKSVTKVYFQALCHRFISIPADGFRESEPARQYRPLKALKNGDIAPQKARLSPFLVILVYRSANNRERRLWSAGESHPAATSGTTQNAQRIRSDLCAVCIAYAYLDWLAGEYGDATLEEVLALTKDMLKDHLPGVSYR